MSNLIFPVLISSIVLPTSLYVEVLTLGTWNVLCVEVVEGTSGSAHSPAQSVFVQEQDTSEQVKEDRVKTQDISSLQALEEASSAPQSQTVYWM